MGDESDTFETGGAEVTFDDMPDGADATELGDDGDDDGTQDLELDAEPSLMEDPKHVSVRFTFLDPDLLRQEKQRRDRLEETKASELQESSADQDPTEQEEEEDKRQEDDHEVNEPEITLKIGETVKVVCGLANEASTTINITGVAVNAYALRFNEQRIPYKTEPLYFPGGYLVEAQDEISFPFSLTLPEKREFMQSQVALSIMYSLESEGFVETIFNKTVEFVSSDAINADGVSLSAVFLMVFAGFALLRYVVNLVNDSSTGTSYSSVQGSGASSDESRRRNKKSN